MRRILILLLLNCLSGLHAFAQEDLMKMLQEQMSNEPKEPVTATFKGVRLINGQTVELSSHGVLLLLISHRFGQLNGGSYEFFGLDQATMRLGLEYGVLDWINVG